MKKIILSLFAALFCLPDLKSQTLDQDYSTINNLWYASIWYTAFGSPSRFAQSFTAGLSGNLAAVDLYLNSYSSCLTFQVKIIDGGNPSGAVLASEIVTMPANWNAQTQGFTNVALSTPPAITSGQQYTIEIDTAMNCITDNHVGWIGDSQGSYAGGGFYYDGVPQTGYDVNFKTYVSVSTGIYPENKNAAFSIYPNPSNGEFNVCTNAENFSISVSDMHGNVIYEGENEKAVHLSSIPAGVYIATLHSSSRHVTVKFVKQ